MRTRESSTSGCVLAALPPQIDLTVGGGKRTRGTGRNAHRGSQSLEAVSGTEGGGTAGEGGRGACGARSGGTSPGCDQQPGPRGWSLAVNKEGRGGRPGDTRSCTRHAWAYAVMPLARPSAGLGTTFTPEVVQSHRNAPRSLLGAFSALSWGGRYVGGGDLGGFTLHGVLGLHRPFRCVTL